jgi:serine phosphatase RsbU (regulator of sigma subunit)/anti-sigma regulatory factor (Ser/Thr protein kinase)/PAS domain-containing protein
MLESNRPNGCGLQTVAARIASGPTVPAPARTGIPSPGSRRRLLGAALAALTVLLAVDLVAGSVLLAPLLVLPPVVLALRAQPRETAIAAGAAVALVIGVGAVDGAFDTGRWRVALPVVAGGGAAAWLTSRVRRRLERDAARLELLVALSGVGTRATVERTAERLCDLVVPTVADLCVIERTAEDGARLILCARASEPTGPGLGERLGEAALLAGCADAAVECRPVLLDPVTDEMLRAAAPDAAGVALLRSLGLRSAVSAPLFARGRAVGVLHMAVGSSGRRYGPRDLHFAEVLAGRVALALENAGLSAELLDAERRFEAIVAGMADGVTVRAADGRLVYANDAALDLLRVESQEALRGLARGEAMALFDVSDEDGRPVPLDELPGVRAWNLDEDPEPMIVRAVVRATGEQRWLLTRATAIRDDDGLPRYVVSFTEDVTAAKRAELAQRILAEAGRVLVSSLDPQRPLQQLAMLAVPELADWCAVDVPGRAGVIEHVAIGHADPVKVALARELRTRNPVTMSEPHGLAAVLRGDVPHVLVDETTDEKLAAYATDADHLALLREVGFNSIMIVPIAAGGTILGALTFVSAHARHFDADDLELGLELGRRAGIALENARLYTERTDIAHTLQVALVPDPVPLAPGWDVAALYRPAGEATEAGGDFYDMVRTKDGWLVVMGDVAGKGARAASLTALARYTLRTAAMLTGDPGAALAALNAGLMRRDEDLAHCTAAVVELVDEGDHARARVYSAGHPLPVLVRRGVARTLGRPGPLLGALEDAQWPFQETLLASGDRLVLYTDGVTDTRGPRERFGDDRLLDLLSSVDGAAPAALVHAIDGAIRGFERGAQRDDTALLAIGRLAPGELALPGGAQAVAIARAAVLGRAEPVIAPDRLRDLVLMTSEVVTNAIRHGGATGPDDRIRLRVDGDAPRVRVEVRDDGPGFDPASAAFVRAAPGDGGLGLGLVDRLADAWGCDREGGSTVVWFEVDPVRRATPIH